MSVAARAQPGRAALRAPIIWGLANTKWWPPFCLVVDFVVAAIIVVEIVAGVHFH